MPIVVVGLNHHTSPVTVREQFALPEAEIPNTLARLRQSGLADEAVILCTCNRVELYAAAAGESAQIMPALERFLVGCAHGTEPADGAIYRLAEPQSLEHLFKVAAGLDSMVLGETEVLGQLKKAYDLALKHEHTGSRLNRAFQRAFNVAKQIRTETNIQRGSISVASVAVELAEKIFTTLADRVVMVIGAGDTSEKTARALLSRGARGLLVTNRTYERAVAMVNELGGRAVPFEQWDGEFERVDIVISSTASPRHLLDRSRLAPLMKLRKNRPLLLIDIAVPRDIEPEVNSLSNVFLYNVDDLQTIADDYLNQRREEIARCEDIIHDKVKGLLAALAPSGFTSRSPLAYGHK
jgi:glutamyl-tRNA reductase